MLANEGKLFTVTRFAGSADEKHQQWLDMRDEGIGGSDVAGIMGLSGWSSPTSIWNEKTGRVPHDDLSGNENVEWGTRNEPTIRNKFREMHPELYVIHPDVTLTSIERPWAHANLDGFVKDPEMGWGILEVKTAQSEHGWFDEDGNECVPIYYQTQVIHYCLVTGYAFARFAVLFHGNKYQERLFVPDEEDLEAVRGAVDEFWEFVQNDVPPSLMTGIPSESRALYGMYAEHDDDMVELSEAEWSDRVSEYSKAAREEKNAKELRSKIGNELKKAIGEHTGMLTDGYEVKWIRSEKRDSGLRVKEVK